MVSKDTPWFRNWAFWIGFGGLLVTALSLAIAWSEHKHRIRAEGQQAEAERRLAAEQAAVKDNLMIFAQEYQQHLNDISTSLSRYEQTGRREDLTRAHTSGRAMVAFVVKWRHVVAPLRNRMDGEIDALGRALDRGNASAFRTTVQILERNANSDLAALRAGVRELAGPGNVVAPVTSPAEPPIAKGVGHSTRVYVLLMITLFAMGVASLWKEIRGTTTGLILALPPALFGLVLLYASVTKWDGTSATLIVVASLYLVPTVTALLLWLRHRRRRGAA